SVVVVPEDRQHKNGGGVARKIRPTPFVLRLNLVSAEEADEIDADLKDARRCYGEGNDETVRANDMDEVHVTRVMVTRCQAGAEAPPRRSLRCRSPVPMLRRRAEHTGCQHLGAAVSPSAASRRVRPALAGGLPI